ncbi:MAG: hypothetical protein HY298_17520 [Verrucomicrobia bacterium]|nr:hypothetical protein [Verrucomicrobiota bacterium]
MTNLSIIDAHVHFWNLERLRYPWLATVPAIGNPNAKSPDQWTDVTPQIPGVLFRAPSDPAWGGDPVRAFNRHLSRTRCVTGRVDGHGEAVKVSVLGFQYPDPGMGRPDPRWLWSRVR